MNSPKPLLLSPKNMARVYEERAAISDPAKYSYRILIGKGQWLYFVAPGHIQNINHPGVAVLNGWVDDFLSATDDRRIIFVEGGVVPGFYETAQETIQHKAEGGLALKLAAHHSHLVESPEPNQYTEMKLMLESHTLQSVMAYYIVRQHEQWARGDKQNFPDFEKYIMQHVANYERLLPSRLKHKPLAYSSVLDLCVVETNNTFELEERVPSNIYSDPSNNPVAATSSRIRDEHILNRILYAQSLGLSILLVYGSAHAITLEPALRSLSIE